MDANATITAHPVVSQEKFAEARKALLLKEKEITKMREKVAAQLRELPWVKIEKPYSFEGEDGPVTLSELFAGRSQLIVKHFMLAPGQNEGCVGCSFEVDHIEGALVHLQNHDVSYVAVARAPMDEISAYKERMGWNVPWVSSASSDFNYDFKVSFTPEQMAAGKCDYNYELQSVPLEDLPGRTVFYKNEAGEIFMTYTSYARGMEELLSSYVCLDVTPKGRNEKEGLTDWVRHHDRYGAAGHVANNGRWIPASIDSGSGGDCCHGSDKNK